MHATIQGNQHFNAIILGHQLSVPTDNFTALGFLTRQHLLYLAFANHRV